MRRKLLFILFFVVFNLLVNGQTNFRLNWYYQERYHIENVRVDWNTYWEINPYGQQVYYERWKFAKWYRYTGRQTYHYWGYNPITGCYQRQYKTEYGTFWYYKWVVYRRYFHYWNGLKVYDN